MNCSWISTEGVSASKQIQDAGQRSTVPTARTQNDLNWWILSHESESWASRASMWWNRPLLPFSDFSSWSFSFSSSSGGEKYMKPFIPSSRGINALCKYHNPILPTQAKKQEKLQSVWRQQRVYRGCHSACFSQGESVLMIHAGKEPPIHTSGSMLSILEINNTNAISTLLLGIICSFHSDLPWWFPVHGTEHKSSANSANNMMSVTCWCVWYYLYTGVQHENVI